jgi:hypothetical protein
LLGLQEGHSRHLYKVLAREERKSPPLLVAGLEAIWEQCSFEQTVLATLIDRERTVEVPKPQERIYEETLRAFLELFFGQFSFTGQYFGRENVIITAAAPAIAQYKYGIAMLRTRSDATC